MFSIPKSLIPDLVMLNGNIVTVDKAFTIAEAVATKNGKIVAVGKTEDLKEWIGEKTNILDLKGATVLPGINDSHAHPIQFGLKRPPFILDIRFPTVKSIKEIKDAVAQKINTVSPDEWIEGYGWNEGYLDEIKNGTQIGVSRFDLDAISPANPVCLTRYDYHTIWVNSRALELAGITETTPDPPGGKIVRDPNHGKPTGLLMEEASALVRSLIPPPSDNTVKDAIVSAMKEYNSLGITSVTDAAVDPNMVRLYNDVYNEGQFTVRMNLLMNWTGIGGSMSLASLKDALKWTGTHTGFGNDWLKIGGIKIFADGMPSLKTSWEYEEFLGGGHGSLIVHGETDEERYNELVNIIGYAHRHGFQVGVHVCGERGIDASVEGFVRAMRSCPWNARHYIIHGNLVSRTTAKKMSEYGIGMSVQMLVKYRISHMLEKTIGRQRASYAFPLRMLIDSGVHVCDSSDAPVMYPDWKLGMMAAITRKSEATGEVVGPDQCISLEEAVRINTIEGAWLDHLEERKGSIEVGKLADFCVVGENIMGMDPQDLPKVPVLMTMVDGKVVHNADPAYLNPK